MNRPAGFIVGLTGGVAAGKTEVAKRFEQRGVPVHDADLGAREVVAAGSDGLSELVRRLGSGILDAAGHLDRTAMRQRAFTEPAVRQTLESVIHPRVRQWLEQRARNSEGPYCLLAIPLLAENASHYRWLDRVLVVDAADSMRLARLMRRDGIDEMLARRMLAQQAGRHARLASADDIIENDGDHATLDARVAALHARYLALGADKSAAHGDG